MEFSQKSESNSPLVKPSASDARTFGSASRDPIVARLSAPAASSIAIPNGPVHNSASNPATAASTLRMLVRLSPIQLRALLSHPGSSGARSFVASFSFFARSRASASCVPSSSRALRSTSSRAPCALFTAVTASLSRVFAAFRRAWADSSSGPSWKVCPASFRSGSCFAVSCRASAVFRSPLWSAASTSYLCASSRRPVSPPCQLPRWPAARVSDLWASFMYFGRSPSRASRKPTAASPSQKLDSPSSLSIFWYAVCSALAEFTSWVRSFSTSPGSPGTGFQPRWT